MDRPAVLLAVLCAVLAPLVPAAAVPATAADAGPSIAATVDGATLGEERVVVTTDPTLALDVSADRRIRTVSVRVDGAVVRSMSPNATDVSRSVPLDLGRGDNRVQVVAETAGGRTAGVVGTVVVDVAAPRAAYTSPFSAGKLDGPPDTVRVRTPSIRLAGDLSDESGVATVLITHTYTYGYAGTTRRHRRSHSIRDPGGSFSQPLFLGLGANRVEVRLVDRTGRVRTDEFTVQLRDGDPPVVRFERIERIDGGSRVRVAGVVSDDVKVDSVAVTGGYANGQRYLVRPTTLEPDPDRRSVAFETTVPAGPRTGQVRIVATDAEGATATRELPDEYGRPVAPELRLDAAATRVENGTVRVRGTVSGGEIERVVVETATTDGERIAFATVHPGPVARTVDVERRLAAAGTGRTVVTLRAVDAAGTERTTSLTVGEPAAGTADPTATAASTTPPSTPDPDDPLPAPDSPATVAGAAVATLSLLGASAAFVLR